RQLQLLVEVGLGEVQARVGADEQRLTAGFACRCQLDGVRSGIDEWSGGGRRWPGHRTADTRRPGVSQVPDRAIDAGLRRQDGLPAAPARTFFLLTVLVRLLFTAERGHLCAVA